MVDTNQTPTTPCKGLLSDPVHLLAFGFGSGCSRFAPGTFGTLAAIPIFLILNQLSTSLYLVITLFMFLIGIWLCSETTKKLKVHDHPGIVWDEIVGYLVTMIAAPKGWIWIVVGFVLFRIFDILKPWPISIADKKIHGGFGIMFDDVIAGVFAFFLLHIIAYYSIAYDI